VKFVFCSITVDAADLVLVVVGQQPTVSGNGNFVFTTPGI